MGFGWCWTSAEDTAFCNQSGAQPAAGALTFGAGGRGADKWPSKGGDPFGSSRFLPVVRAVVRCKDGSTPIINVCDMAMVLTVVPPPPLADAVLGC